MESSDPASPVRVPNELATPDDCDRYITDFEIGYDHRIAQ